MSRILIDPAMPTSAKFAGGPDLAVLLWFKAMCYSAGALSNGFVPDEVMYGLSKARRKEIDKALHHLCSVQPGCDNPSAYRRPGGWLLHDYDDPIYVNPLRDGVQALQLQRQKSASAAGKVSAAVRRAKYGTAQPLRVQDPNESPNDPPNDSFDNRSTASPNDSRTTPLERPRTAQRSLASPSNAVTETPADQEDVLREHGDVVMEVTTNGKAVLTSHAVKLVDWLLVNRGDHTFSTRKEQEQELATASQMLQLGISASDVMTRLQSYRDAMDPDDVASSLGYYYGRLQDDAHAALKAPRSHTSSNGPTRITPVLPAKRGAK